MMRGEKYSIGSMMTDGLIYLPFKIITTKYMNHWGNLPEGITEQNLFASSTLLAKSSPFKYLLIMSLKNREALPSSSSTKWRTPQQQSTTTTKLSSWTGR
jgi:hypothetical protein